LMILDNVEFLPPIFYQPSCERSEHGWYL
jgi:hypothetical protein